MDSFSIKTQVWVAVFCILYLFTHLINMPDIVRNALLVAPGLCAYIHYLYFAKPFAKITSLIFGLVISLFMTFSILYNHNANFQNLLWIWSYMGLGLVLLRYGISVQLATILVYLVGGVFAVYMIIGVPVQSVIYGGSENNISSICILSLILYYLAYHHKRLKHFSYFKSDRKISDTLSYFPILFIGLIVVWSTSRTGLLSVFFLALGIYWVNKKTISVANIIILCSIFVLLFVVFFVYDTFSFTNNIKEKYEKFGMQSSRIEIWSEYLSGLFLNVRNFVLGVNYESGDFPLLVHYKGNIHNSFLILHSKYGLIPFLLFIFLLLRTAIVSFKKGDRLIFITLVAVFIRMSLDWIAFPGAFDILIFYYVFKNPVKGIVAYYKRKR
ncbi:MAG: hypothetical protein II937_12995 [Bacteroidales bacterium]|nr:hypothetical protein [Bacteroidales bacterium]